VCLDRGGNIICAPSGKIGERFCDKLGGKADSGEVVAVRDTFGESKKRAG